jgi:hypothetical protein
MRHDTIASWRRDDRRLARIGRLLGLASLACLASVIWLVYVRDHADILLALLTPLGVAAGLGRILVWRVRAVPEPIRRLAFGAQPDADAAWSLIEAHRDELLAAAVLPGTIHDPPIETLDRAGLTERARRASPHDGRLALRRFLVVWCVAAAVLMTVLLTVELAPPIVYRGL